MHEKNTKHTRKTRENHTKVTKKVPHRSLGGPRVCPILPCISDQTQGKSRKLSTFRNRKKIRKKRTLLELLSRHLAASCEIIL